MIEYRNLENVPISQIHLAFVDAFANYQEPFDLSQEQLDYLLTRRGYTPMASFGAFHENRLVGFVLNALGKWNGIQTVYDTGTGIVQEYQGKGLAGKLFDYTLQGLKQQHTKQYLLEVLKANTNAIKLYQKKGFKVVREFDYYVFNKKTVSFPPENTSTDLTIRKTTNLNRELAKSFWEIEPSWQNSFDSVQRKRDSFTILEATVNNQSVGYAIIEGHTGDIPQLAVQKEFRRQGIASALLNELMQSTKKEQIRVINVEANYLPFKNLFQKLQIPLRGEQYEMTLPL